MVHQGGAEVPRDEIVARQEDHAERQVFGPVDAEAAPLGLADQQLARQLGQDAAAVAGLGVGVDGAAMGDVGDRLKRLDENVVVLLTGDPCDEADAAGIMLVATVYTEARSPHQHAERSCPDLTPPQETKTDERTTTKYPSGTQKAGPEMTDLPPSGYLARCTGVAPPPVWERRARP